MLNPDDTEIKLHGIAASPGICIGKAYLVGREGVDDQPRARRAPGRELGGDPVQTDPGAGEGDLRIPRKSRRPRAVPDWYGSVRGPR